MASTLESGFFALFRPFQYTMRFRPHQYILANQCNSFRILVQLISKAFTFSKRLL